MTDSKTSEGCLRKLIFIKDGEDPIQANIRVEVLAHDSWQIKMGINEAGANDGQSPFPLLYRLVWATDLMVAALVMILAASFSAYKFSHFQNIKYH